MATEAAGLQERLQAALGDAHIIERELGGAGMSRVFVARDARLGRRVVVKVLRPDSAAGLSARRFAREVALAARLQHPHLVPLLSAGEVDGLPFYTMPYVEGESLRERLTREGALPVADTVRLVRELADAMAYAHAQGVIHRDVKPENVLLSGGHAVVADFGVAKALASSSLTRGAEWESTAVTGHSTARGMAVGTPAYMAPEQVVADPTVDARADLYALGVVAYELLTGRTPFGGRATQAVLAAQLTELPPPLDGHRADVPPALDALVTRLLAKDPAARPQSAAEVLRALDALPLSGAAPTATTGASRGPGVRAVVLALVAALVLAIAGVAWLRTRARAAAPVEPSARAQSALSSRYVNSSWS